MTRTQESWFGRNFGIVDERSKCSSVNQTDRTRFLLKTGDHIMNIDLRNSSNIVLLPNSDQVASALAEHQLLTESLTSLSMLI